MKKIKILGVLTHFKLSKNKDGVEKATIGAVDYYRLVQPLLHLPKDKFEVDIEYEAIGKNSKFKTVEEIAKHYDFCYFSYIDSVPFYIQLKVAGMKYGMKMIIDLDDNIWNVDPTHPYYKGDFAPGTEKMFNRNAILIDADRVITTNRFLRYQINEYTKRPLNEIFISPNYIDLDEFDYKKIPPKEGKEFVIGYTGGSSHFKDMNKEAFTKGLTKVMDKYPNVVFKTTFYMPQLKALWGRRYKYELGRSDVYKYIENLWPQMMTSDVMVAPLEYSKYSRSKSYVKYLEYSAGKKPSICEVIDPYNEVLSGHSERGLQASSADDWFKHLSYIIENPDKAKKMGEEAYNYVKKYHTVQNNISKLEKYLTSIV